MKTNIYVEGGGTSKQLRTACRKGFSKFIEKAGLVGQMPKVIACGSRDDAYNSFRTNHADGKETAVLLVDAEATVSASDPWEHLRTRDKWERPVGAASNQCHLMVQAMESWFLADVATLETFYGQGFRPQRLPANPQKEAIAKQDVLDGLNQATSTTAKGNYNKGRDSFLILEKLDPDKVKQALPSTNRFIEALKSGGQ